ncbi:MAG: hypothetical protein LBQ93_03060 [Treponema sp.]|jgi:hypothetical protein|nr:hypothetical protein [Treponema sp.]
MVLLVCILSISCGIDEYYYLPQLPESNINTTSNTEAVIVIPPIDYIYYAAGYTIFYRIYTSERPWLASITQSDMSYISSSLASDYSSLYNVTDPTNTTLVLSLSTFTNMNYFEIQFEGANVRSKLSTTGGTLRITFPTASSSIPLVNINDEEINLRRSRNLISPVPNDRYFRNTFELRDRANANSNANADVAVYSDSSQYTYVSMYIVAIGTNPENFNPILSKPTHISVFRLPDH